MEIFVGNLPQSATENELNRLFRGYTHGAFRIVTIRKDRVNARRFGIGEVRPERAAQKAVKRLQGWMLGGHRLVIREFIYRAPGNERRALNWRRRPWPRAERRHAERRLGSRARHIDEPIVVVEHYPDWAVNE